MSVVNIVVIEYVSLYEVAGCSFVKRHGRPCLPETRYLRYRLSCLAYAIFCAGTGWGRESVSNRHLWGAGVSRDIS